jgi:hypothetical protein
MEFTMLQLTKIYDPRDELDKANRDELFQFAQSRGIQEIDEKMFMGANAAIMMRKVMRQKGIINIKIPPRQLGMPQGAIAAEPSGETITAEEMAERDYTAQRAAPVVPAATVEKMSIQEMRKECTKRGIHMDRTDNIAKLREKLSNGK